MTMVDVGQGTGIAFGNRQFADAACASSPTNPDANTFYANYYTAPHAGCTPRGPSLSIGNDYCDMASSPPQACAGRDPNAASSRTALHRTEATTRQPSTRRPTTIQAGRVLDRSARRASRARPARVDLS